MVTPAVRDVAFALEFREANHAVVTDVTSITWRAEVLDVLQQIRSEAIANAKKSGDTAFLNLPYGDLRARLQLRIPGWIGMRDDIGLRDLGSRNRAPKPWGYLRHGDSHWVTLQDVFAEWSEGTLARFAEGRSAYEIGIAQLRKLRTTDGLTNNKVAAVQLFPWRDGKAPDTPSPFDVAAGYLGSQLAGKELFPSLGQVARILSGPDNNWTELMTRPAHAAGGRFSLVCRLSVQTLPGATKTLVYVQFIRRRWAAALTTGYAQNRSIGGFVLPHEHRPDVGFRFTINRARDRSWRTDLAYSELEHHLHLRPNYHDERVANYPCDDKASVLVMVKPDITEDTDSQLLAGVPLADQGDTFERVSEELQRLGLCPFSRFRAAKVKPVKAPHLRMIKAEVTLARLLERHSIDDDDASGIEEGLSAATSAPVQRWFKTLPQPDREHKLLTAAIRTLVQGTAYASDTDRQTIYLLTDSPEDIEWVRTTVDAMLGPTIKVVTAPLPANTHGPRDTLPVPTEKTRTRFDARVQAWETFAATCGIKPRSMVLVQARMFYKNSVGKTQADDVVNKLAARKALASQLGCTVQYLLPSELGRVEKFLPRVQAAVLDLVFGHGGSVWGLPAASGQYFSDSKAPAWVGAITSLQASTQWDTKQSVLVATRLNSQTGQAWVRFGHVELAPVITPWMRFDEGARYVASRGRLELPKKPDVLRNFFSSFCAATLNDITSLDGNAVVFVDSTRSARLGRWLTDAGVRSGNPEIVPHASSTAIQWPGLRLIRIRELAPVCAQIKTFPAESDDGEPVRVWTSTQRLMHLPDAVVPTYWSLAKPVSHHKRGASCYRTMLLPRSKRSESASSFQSIAAQPDKQHVTPHAIEIAVLQAQPDDDPLQLAAFSQHLRAGMLTARNETWVTTPSPLRIVDKLGDYMRA